MGWSNLFDGMFGSSDPAVSADAVGAAVPANDPAVMAGVDPADVAAIDGAAPANVGASNPAWWEKPLKQMMPMIMGAALHPQQTPRAPVAPGGHGVNVNSSGELKTVDELRSAANNNPLDDLNKWAGLFK
ncbi:hypothetical protein GZZ44_10475 [Klebsiella aerogenes]|uniref:hypothetical protein n=1 Tax=Klebsiella aerogenes TaxID=548 RepID=UPI00190E96AE|nr:hypothetical protein [Klebsiella aerogenes]MBK0633372.1 hypothetical protein [Klebsiella aerogenes]